MGCENMSRYEKYRSTREGIKDLNSKNKMAKAIVDEADNEEDDFLGFLKQPGQAVSRVEHFEDTLEVAKTFEDVKNEPTPEIDRALKSAKRSLGEHEDTRLSILNKIKNPQVEVVNLDDQDQYQTQDFKKGMFIATSQEQNEGSTVLGNHSTPEPVKENKRPKSLLERLEEMSIKESKEPKETDATDVQEIKEIKTPMVKEPEIKAAKTKQELPDPSLFEDVNLDKTIIVSKNEPIELDIHDEIGENSKGALILNVIIVILVVVFVVLCGYIAMQII